MSETNDGEVIDLNAWMKGKEAEVAKTKAGPLVSIDERRLTQLVKGRIMLAALVRKEGRIRITRRELEAVQQRDKLDVKVQENGDLMVTFLEG